MFKKIKSIFNRLLISKDAQYLNEAEKDFDDLMKELESDEDELLNFEKQIQKEFAGLKKDVKELDEEVSELVMSKN